MEHWDRWVDAALAKLSSSNLSRSTRPISFHPPAATCPHVQTFDGPHPRDRSSVIAPMDGPTLRRWLADLPNPNPSAGDDAESCGDGQLILFSGNDYLGLSAHPAVAKAAVMAAEEHGMGPRGSALICGYTSYHKMLEAALAELKKKEVNGIALEF